VNQEAPRLRLSSTVDLSKAKGHSRCNGTGICGYRDIENPEHPGEKIQVPVICRCVSRRGGVQKDAFDKMAQEIQQQVLDGTFGETLAFDVKGLPTQSRAIKIEELKQTVANPDTGELVRRQIEKALEILAKEA